MFYLHILPLSCFVLGLTISIGEDEGDDTDDNIGKNDYVDDSTSSNHLRPPRSPLLITKKDRDAFR